jgi:hypothetical protein
MPKTYSSSRSHSSNHPRLTAHWAQIRSCKGGRITKRRSSVQQLRGRHADKTGPIVSKSADMSSLNKPNTEFTNGDLPPIIDGPKVNSQETPLTESSYESYPMDTTYQNPFLPILGTPIQPLILSEAPNWPLTSTRKFS